MLINHTGSRCNWMKKFLSLNENLTILDQENVLMRILFR